MKLIIPVAFVRQCGDDTRLAFLVLLQYRFYFLLSMFCMFDVRTYLRNAGGTGSSVTEKNCYVMFV